jgi:hypothetical protein
VTSAKLSRKNADEVKDLAQKATAQLPTVMADVGAAKEGMEQAIGMERKIRALRKTLWTHAKKAAEGEIPKLIQKLREKARVKAEKEARERAKAFKKDMEEKAQVEGSKAAKVYTDYMDASSKAATNYAKSGDSLVAQAAALQMKAGLEHNQANQFLKIGQMGEAQKLFQQSAGDINAAAKTMADSSNMYNQMIAITGQLPMYLGEAATASFHTRSMYDPDAVPPPPPVAFLQTRAQEHVKQSSLRQRL